MCGVKTPVISTPIAGWTRSWSAFRHYTSSLARLAWLHRETFRNLGTQSNSPLHFIHITGTICALLLNIAALLFESELYYQVFWNITASMKNDLKEKYSGFSDYKTGVHLNTWKLKRCIMHASGMLLKPSKDGVIYGQFVYNADPKLGYPLILKKKFCWIQYTVSWRIKKR